VNEDDARRAVRVTFVNDATTYGCAETSYIVLKQAYGLPDPDDSGPAMALNGGVAYRGGICGALSGAALAIGQLAAARISDHATAKRVARGLMQRVIDQFEDDYGSIECRDLIGFDLQQQGEHDRFIAAGVWKTTCADQVESAVAKLAGLSDRDAWEKAIGELHE
jgi:C_GCAxxG_C_C family probable redox protein